MKITIDRHSDKKWDECVLTIELTEVLSKFIDNHIDDWADAIKESNIENSRSDDFYNDLRIRVKSELIIKQKPNEQKRISNRFISYIRGVFRSNEGKE